MKKIATLVLFILVAHVSCLRAQDIEKDKKEIIYLRQMDQQIDKVVAGIGATNFGPFRVDGKCGYDSHWYCFGDCYILTWSLNFPNFTWLKDVLRNQYANVSANAHKFDTYFEPVKTWMLNALPQFTEVYQKQLIAIKAAQAAYQSHAGNPAEQDKDKANILAAIRVIDGALESAKGSITQGIRNLSTFDQLMNNSLQGVKNLSNTMESSISENQKRVWQQTESFQCDKDYARNRTIEIQNMVRNQFNNVLNSAENFGVNAGKIDASSSIIIADLVIIQNKYKGAMEALQRATESPNSVLQNLHLDITFKFYTDLAAFARGEFRGS